MMRARHLFHEGVLGVVLAVGLVAGLALIDAALAAVVAIMLFGLLVLIIPVVSILYDERESHRLRH